MYSKTYVFSNTFEGFRPKCTFRGCLSKYRRTFIVYMFRRPPEVWSLMSDNALISGTGKVGMHTKWDDCLTSWQVRDIFQYVSFHHVKWIECFICQNREKIASRALCTQAERVPLPLVHESPPQLPAIVDTKLRRQDKLMNFQESWQLRSDMHKKDDRKPNPRVLDDHDNGKPQLLCGLDSSKCTWQRSQHTFNVTFRGSFLYIWWWLWQQIRMWHVA